MLKNPFKKQANTREYQTLITDINSHDSLLLVACDAELKEEIKFPVHSRYSANLLKGVVSRKKQLLPYIASMLKNLGIKS